MATVACEGIARHGIARHGIGTRERRGQRTDGCVQADSSGNGRKVGSEARYRTRQERHGLVLAAAMPTSHLAQEITLSVRTVYADGFISAPASSVPCQYRGAPWAPLGALRAVRSFPVPTILFCTLAGFVVGTDWSRLCVRGSVRGSWSARRVPTRLLPTPWDAGYVGCYLVGT